MRVVTAGIHMNPSSTFFASILVSMLFAGCAKGSVTPPQEDPYVLLCEMSTGEPITFEHVCNVLDVQKIKYGYGGSLWMQVDVFEADLELARNVLKRSLVDPDTHLPLYELYEENERRRIRVLFPAIEELNADFDELALSTKTGLLDDLLCRVRLLKHEFRIGDGDATSILDEINTETSGHLRGWKQKYFSRAGKFEIGYMFRVETYNATDHDKTIAYQDFTVLDDLATIYVSEITRP